MNTGNEFALSDALEQCLKALRNGRTIDETVRAYPQFADELRAMLEATRLVQNTAAPPREVAGAQARVYARLEGYQRARRRPHIFPLQRFAAAAIFIFVAGLFLWQGPQVLSTLQHGSGATATETMLPTQSRTAVNTVTLTPTMTLTSSASPTPSVTGAPVLIVTLTRTPTRVVPVPTRAPTQRPAPTNQPPTNPPAPTDDHGGGSDDSGHSGSGDSGSGSGSHGTPGGSSGGSD